MPDEREVNRLLGRKWNATTEKYEIHAPYLDESELYDHEIPMPISFWGAMVSLVVVFSAAIAATVYIMTR